MARITLNAQQQRAAKWLLVALGTLVAVVILVYIALHVNWPSWTGFDAFVPKSPVQGGFEREKTLWDWLGLLIIPLVLTVGSFIYNRSEKRNDQEKAKQKAVEEQVLQDTRLRDAALREYLDRMSELLLTHQLATSDKGDPVRYVARARTLTILERLDKDPDRKGHVVRFLYEACLIQKDLSVIFLAEANLQGANLDSADLQGADLQGANLRGAKLQEAKLQEADLREAKLEEADLQGADLQGADLQGAIVGQKQLDQARTLKGATMPDGSIHD